jgi:hypothetical protein
MKQTKKWLSKWNIKLHECPDTKEETKKFVDEKFRTAMWTNHCGCKKTYYIKDFNPKCNHSDKTHLGEAIKGKAILLVAQLRMISYHLRCETNRWRVPKEVWEERTCIFCNKGVVETEWHFFLECAAYFGLLVMPVVLYGCEIWGSSMSTCRWRQLKRIQKQLITRKLKVKAIVPYEILLVETSTFPLEETTITKLISYLKKVENMDNQC